MNGTTNVAAAAGVTMPLWLQLIHTASEAATLWVPIASAVWLAVQVYWSLADRARRKRRP